LTARMSGQVSGRPPCVRLRVRTRGNRLDWCGHSEINPVGDLALRAHVPRRGEHDPVAEVDELFRTAVRKERKNSSIVTGNPMDWVTRTLAAPTCSTRITVRRFRIE
jgi:hypothetical protein